MDATKKQQTMAPQAQHIKEEDQEECGSEASHAVLKPGGKGKGDAPAVVKAAHKGKEAAVPVVKKNPSAISTSAQKRKALEMKKRAEDLEATRKGKAAVNAAPKTKKVISSDEEEEEEEEDSSDEDCNEEESEEEDSSDEDYNEEESEEEDSDDDSEYEEEKGLVVARQPPPAMADEVAEEKLPVREQQQMEETHGGDDDDEHAIVEVKNFEGCRMLAEVHRTEDSGVASRTRRRKVLKRLNSQLDYDRDSKGTFSDPINV